MVFSLKKLFSNNNKSGVIAKDRLKLLLISDRTGCSPEMMEMLKKDMFGVVSKYIDINTEECVIDIEKSKKPYLFANIPIKEVKYK
ncbi:MAG: cell division topological specificity factor MinE [Lachnospiraceae bacterium]|nr:cell division topological specificity factor MinE [Lachnospiraceae bacterium]